VISADMCWIRAETSSHQAVATYGLNEVAKRKDEIPDERDGDNSKEDGRDEEQRSQGRLLARWQSRSWTSKRARKILKQTADEWV
jgi:hypothetical protein